MDLMFNLDSLRATKKKCSDTVKELNKLDRDIMKGLDTLKKDWQTPAGRKFFEEHNTEWHAQVVQYVNITNAVEDLLQCAIFEYQKVLDEASRLRIRL